MKRLAALMALACAGACGGASTPASAPDTTPTTAPVVTVPDVTDPPPLTVGTPLCQDATRELAEYIVGPLDGHVDVHQYADGPFAHLLERSFQVCGRIEWDETMNATLLDSADAIDTAHRRGCAVAEFLNDSADVPLPQGCV